MAMENFTLKCDAEVMTILSVEAGTVYEVDAAANDVTGGEGGPVSLAGTGAAEAVTIVAVVAVAVPPHINIHAMQVQASFYCHSANRHQGVSNLSEVKASPIGCCAGSWMFVFSACACPIQEGDSC